MLRQRRLELVHSKSREEYMRYRNDHSDAYSDREHLNRVLSDQLRDTYRGYCSVCHQTVDFRVFRKADGTPMWRESFICPSCGFNTRMRAFLHLYLADLKGKECYITEQVTPLFQKLSRELKPMHGSEYLESELGRMREDGVRCEDLTQLTFPSNSFDRILSFEVLEHIPEYRKAFTEILRVLRPGGRLILSVPFIWNLPCTLIRASIAADGGIVHHEPPDYHGNPIDPKGSLCYYYFSFDLLDEMRDFGFKDVEVTEYWSQDFAYLGTSNQTYITATKPS